MSREAEEFRMGHLVRTAEVWKRLVELGATEESVLDYEFSFRAKDKGSAESLKSELSDYPIEVTSEGFFKNRSLWLVALARSPWSEEQLLKWVDYLIQVGNDTGCEFDGCGASAP